MRQPLNAHRSINTAQRGCKQAELDASGLFAVLSEDADDGLRQLRPHTLACGTVSFHQCPLSHVENVNGYKVKSPAVIFGGNWKLAE